MKLFPMTTTMSFLAIAASCAAQPPDAKSLHERTSATAVFIKIEGVGKDNRPHHWTGSGVAIHRGGWVITNRHVAPGDARTANTIRVVFNAGTVEEFSGPAEVVLVHADRDLALLKCQVEKEPSIMSLGSTAGIRLTDEMFSVGFPLGNLVAANNSNPSVSIVTGKISSLQKDSDGRLCWIDAAASVAGGNSGSALVDQHGNLIGIVTRRYEGFARAIPVEFVIELLGEAALDVAPVRNPRVDPDGDLHVVVKPRGPASKLISGNAEIIAANTADVPLIPDGDGKLTGILPVTAQGSGAQLRAVRIRATADSGITFERIVELNRERDGKVPLRGTIHSITLSSLKPNGWRWDADEPDPYCKLYINSLLVKQTGAARNRFRFLEVTEFDCKVGDKIRVVVYDEDVSQHDWAGEISFTAESDQKVTQPTAGKIDACEITLRPIPARLPLSQ